MVSLVFVDSSQMSRLKADDCGSLNFLVISVHVPINIIIFVKKKRSASLLWRISCLCPINQGFNSVTVHYMYHHSEATVSHDTV